MQEKLQTSGDYVVLAYSEPLENVKTFTSIDSSIVNSGVGTIIKKEFRYSFDEETYSEYIELTLENLNDIGLTAEQKVWFQFRFALMSGGPVTVSNVSLQFENFPVDPYKGYVAPNIQSDNYALPLTYKSGAQWDPYRMGKAVRLYKDLNLMVNSLFGHEIHYYRALPQGRSKDVFLMEYSLYEHEDKKCIKVIVPNNEFPDNKLNMGPFGVDFEMPFEIQIDKDYFQSIYGEGAGPQKRDVLYFPRTGRIYEISSSYLFRDFMNEPLYFKATLIKWQPKSNAEASPDLSALEAFTVSAEKLFGKEQKEERIDIANPVQFEPTTDISDPVREYLSPLAEILDTPVMNYFLTVAEHQYNLANTISENLASVKLGTDQIKLLSLEATYFIRSGAEINKAVTTSSNTLAIGSTATISISVGPDLNYAYGQSVTLTHNSSNYMSGTIDSYQTAGLTGSLQVTLNSSTGSGTYSNWTLNVPYTDSPETLYSMRKVKYKGLTPDGEAVFEYFGGLSQYANQYSKAEIFNADSIFSLYTTEYVADTPSVPLFSCKYASNSYQLPIVKYKAINEFTSSQDRAFSAWFKLNANSKFSNEVESYTYDEYAEILTVNYSRPHEFFVGDQISLRRRTGNFDLIGKIKTVNSKNQFTLEINPEILSYIQAVFGNAWLSYTDLTLQLTYPKVFVDSIKADKGLKIELWGKRYFIVTTNKKQYFFILPNTQADLSENKWYSICVSLSNLFTQLTLNIWEMEWNATTNLPATSDLKIVFGNTVKNFPREDRSSYYTYGFPSSNMEMTNIRVWAQKIETDKQPLVLNQNIVKDASLAIVIDNAVPISRLPYISYTH